MSARQRYSASARTKADWVRYLGEVAQERRYCKMHDLFDCWVAHPLGHVAH